MKDNLYYVGLSKATSGYGPRLYDVVMEAVSEKGAMLTSDRSSVSGDAKKVWEYYFKNRGDVKKTPLEPEDWTKNQSLIDPKLYGRRETWPPSTDPAWVLQSGYSKSPSLINDPNSVVRANKKPAVSSAQMALQYFQRANGGRLGFADGGSVPALVSNGEAYVPPKLAKKIGYGTLGKMNQADKNGMGRFSEGGISVFKGPGSGTSDSIPTSLPVGSFIIREKATKALGLNKGGGIGVRKFAKGGKAPGDFEANVQALMVEFENLSKATKLRVYDEQRASGASVRAALAAAKTAASLELTTTANQKYMESLDPKSKIDPKAINEALNRIKADPSSSRLSVADIKASRQSVQVSKAVTVGKSSSADVASEYLQLRARLAGQSLEEFTNSLQKQTIDLAEQLKNNLPGALDAFQEQLYRAKNTFDNIASKKYDLSSSTTKTEDLAQANESVLDSLTNLLGSDYDDTREAGSLSLRQLADKISEAIRNGLKPSDAFKITEVQAAIQSTSTDEALVARAKRDVSNKAGIDQSQIKVSGADLAKQTGLTNLYKEVDKTAGRFAKFSLALGAAGSVMQQFLESTESRSNAIASAAIGGGTSTASAVMAGGSQLLQSLSGFGQMGGAVGGIANSILPMATKLISGPFGIAATAAIGIAAAFKDAHNAAREFDKQMAGKRVENSLNRIGTMFDEFSKDMSKKNILDDVANELKNAASAAFASINIDATVPKMFWVNMIDAGMGGSEAAQRSMVLEKQGVGAYLNTLGGTQASAANLEKYMSDLAPQLAAQQSASLKPIADNFFKLSEQRLRTGSSIDDIMGQLRDGAGGVSDFARAIARSNPIIEESIIRTQARADIGDIEKQKIVDAIIAREAEKQTILNNTAIMRQIDFEKLNKGVATFVNSLSRIYDNMEMSINKASFEIQKLSDSAELAQSSLSGGAKAGSTNLSAINILQNRRAYAPNEQQGAVDLAGSFFGQAGPAISSILNIGDKLESTILQTINRTRQNEPGAVDERVLASIRSNLDKALTDLQIPDNLVPKLSKEIKDAFKDITTTGDLDVTSFDQIAEKVPGLTKQIDSARRAQEIAVKALEFYQNQLTEYSNSMNTMIDLQMEANKDFARASDILNNGTNELAKTFGREISLRDVTNNTLAKTRRQTGGATDPADITKNILNLENARKLIQASSNESANKGQAGKDEFVVMQDRLRNNNFALRQNYDALKNLAENTDIASAALGKIQEIQAKRQAGAGLIERVVTSNPEDLAKLNASMGRLNNNMQGISNRNTTPEQRGETLQLFNQIAPLLGDGAQQNALKANVLESQLLESGMGISPMFAQVLDSLRNPEGDPEMQAAIAAYEYGNSLQATANERLGELKEVMIQNNADVAAEKLKVAITGAKLTFDQTLLSDIKTGIFDLKSLVEKRAPAAGLARGGVVYASAGQSIDFAPRGTDTVPAMLTPGEFVVNRKATRSNLPLLQNINSGKYSKGGKVNYLADGGIVPSAQWSTSGSTGLLDRSKRTYKEKETIGQYYTIKREPEDDDYVKHRVVEASYYAAKSESDVAKAGDSRVGKIKWNPGIYFDDMEIIGEDDWGQGVMGYKVQLGGSPPVKNFGDINLLKPDIVLGDRKHIKESDIDSYIKTYDSILGKIVSTKYDYSSTKDISPPAPKIDPKLFPDRANAPIPGTMRSTPSHKISGLNYIDKNKKLIIQDIEKRQKSLDGFYPDFSSRTGIDGSNSIKNYSNFQKSAQGRNKNQISSTESHSFPGNLVVDPTTYYTKDGDLFINLTQDLDNLKKDKLKETDASFAVRSQISPLEDFYNGKLFSLDLDKNILDGPKVTNKGLPLTLYNIENDKWERIIKDRSDLRTIDNIENLISLDPQDFIELFEKKPNFGGILSTKYRPWISKDFEDKTKITPQQLIGSQKQAFASKYFGDITSDTFGNAADDLYFKYTKVSKGSSYNPNTLGFENDLSEYMVIAQQDNSPFSTLGEALYVPAQNWDLFIQGLQDDITEAKRRFNPDSKFEWDYQFDPVTDIAPGFKNDAMVNKAMEGKVILPSFNNILDTKDFSTTNSDYIAYLKKQSEEKEKNERIAKAKQKLTTTLGPKETFTDYKKVAIARAVYDVGKDKIGLKSLKPTSIGGIGTVLSELNEKTTRLSRDSSKKAPNQRLTPEFLLNDAYRAFFNELFIGTYSGPTASTPEFLKGLGIPLQDESFDTSKAPKIPRKGFPGQQEPQYADYRDKTPVEKAIKNIINRQMAIKAAKSFAGSLDAKDIEQGSIKGSEARIYDNGVLLKPGQEFIPKSYNDLMRIGFNPKNVFQTATTRNEKYLSKIKTLFDEGADEAGNLIFNPGDKSALTFSKSIDILIDWYSTMQDSLLNLSLKKEQLEQNSLNLLGGSPTYNNYKNKYEDAQSANAFITGNTLGRLPEQEDLRNQIALELAEPIQPVTKARGGLIYASAGQLVNFQSKGTDTVPAMLTPGEFVVNRGATQKNLPLLQSINSGNYSRGGVVYAKEGAIIGNSRTQQTYAPSETADQKFISAIKQIVKTENLTISKINILITRADSISQQIDRMILLENNNSSILQSILITLKEIKLEKPKNDEKSSTRLLDTPVTAADVFPQTSANVIPGTGLQQADLPRGTFALPMPTPKPEPASVRGARRVLDFQLPPAKSNGGLIYASNGRLINFQPKGTDTVPAMLTPGEFVINRRATQNNLPLLESINSGNYANGGVVYAREGAMVNAKQFQTQTFAPAASSDDKLVNSIGGVVKAETSTNNKIEFLINKVISIGQQIDKIIVLQNNSLSVLLAVYEKLGPLEVLPEIKSSIEALPAAICACVADSRPTMEEPDGVPTVLLPSEQKQQEVPRPAWLDELANMQIPAPSWLPINVEVNYPEWLPVTVEPGFDIPIPLEKFGCCKDETDQPTVRPPLPPPAQTPVPERTRPPIYAEDPNQPIPNFPLTPEDPNQPIPNFPLTPEKPLSASTIENRISAKDFSYDIPIPSNPVPATPSQNTRMEDTTIRAEAASEAEMNKWLDEEIRAREDADRERKQTSEIGALKTVKGLTAAKDTAYSAIDTVNALKEGDTLSALTGGLSVVEGLGNFGNNSPLSAAGDIAGITGSSINIARGLYEYGTTGNSDRLQYQGAQDALNIAQNTAGLLTNPTVVGPASTLPGSLGGVSQGLGIAGVALQTGLDIGTEAIKTPDTIDAQQRSMTERLVLAGLTGNGSVGGSDLGDKIGLEKGGSADIMAAYYENLLNKTAQGATVGGVPGAVVGLSAATIGETYKAGSGLARDTAVSRESQIRTDRMLETSKTKKVDASGNVVDKLPQDWSMGIDISTESAIREVAVIQDRLEELKTLQEQGLGTYDSAPIQDYISQQEVALNDAKTRLQNIAVEQVDKENWSFYDLGLESPEVKARLDEFNNRLSSAIDQLGLSLTQNLDSSKLPAVNLPAEAPMSEDGNYVVKNPNYRKTGGLIYASNGALINFQPRGTDTVPAMLTPGEFVVNRSATQKNLPLLQSINSGYYADGGIAGLKQGLVATQETLAPSVSEMKKIEAKYLTVLPKQKDLLINPYKKQSDLLENRIKQLYSDFLIYSDKYSNIKINDLKAVGFLSQDVDFSLDQVNPKQVFKNAAMSIDPNMKKLARDNIDTRIPIMFDNVQDQNLFKMMMESGMEADRAMQLTRDPDRWNRITTAELQAINDNELHKARIDLATKSGLDFETTNLRKNVAHPDFLNNAQRFLDIAIDNIRKEKLRAIAIKEGIANPDDKWLESVIREQDSNIRKKLWNKGLYEDKQDNQDSIDVWLKQWIKPRSLSEAEIEANRRMQQFEKDIGEFTGGDAAKEELDRLRGRSLRSTIRNPDGQPLPLGAGIKDATGKPLPLGADIKRAVGEPPPPQYAEKTKALYDSVMQKAKTASESKPRKAEPLNRTENARLLSFLNLLQMKNIRYSQLNDEGVIPQPAEGVDYVKFFLGLRYLKVINEGKDNRSFEEFQQQPYKPMKEVVARLKAERLAKEKARKQEIMRRRGINTLGAGYATLWGDAPPQRKPRPQRRNRTTNRRRTSTPTAKDRARVDAQVAVPSTTATPPTAQTPPPGFGAVVAYLPEYTPPSRPTPDTSLGIPGGDPVEPHARARGMSEEDIARGKKRLKELSENERRNLSPPTSTQSVPDIDFYNDWVRIEQEKRSKHLESVLRKRTKDIGTEDALKLQMIEAGYTDGRMQTSINDLIRNTQATLEKMWNAKDMVLLGDKMKRWEESYERERVYAGKEWVRDDEMQEWFAKNARTRAQNRASSENRQVTDKLQKDKIDIAKTLGYVPDNLGRLGPFGNNGMFEESTLAQQRLEQSGYTNSPTTGFEAGPESLGATKLSEKDKARMNSLRERNDKLSQKWAKENFNRLVNEQTEILEGSKLSVQKLRSFLESRGIKPSIPNDGEYRPYEEGALIDQYPIDKERPLLRWVRGTGSGKYARPDHLGMSAIRLSDDLLMHRAERMYWTSHKYLDEPEVVEAIRATLNVEPDEKPAGLWSTDDYEKQINEYMKRYQEWKRGIMFWRPEETNPDDAEKYRMFSPQERIRSTQRQQEIDKYHKEHADDPNTPEREDLPSMVYPVLGKWIESQKRAAELAKEAQKSNNKQPVDNTKKENPIYRHKGGAIYASNGTLVNYEPRGTDTVPAMLTPGEFVINRASTQKYRPVLEAINSGNYSNGGIAYLANGGGAEAVKRTVDTGKAVKAIGANVSDAGYLDFSGNTTEDIIEDIVKLTELPMKLIDNINNLNIRDLIAFGRYNLNTTFGTNIHQTFIEKYFKKLNDWVETNKLSGRLGTISSFENLYNLQKVLRDENATIDQKIFGGADALVGVLSGLNSAYEAKAFPAAVMNRVGFLGNLKGLGVAGAAVSVAKNAYAGYKDKEAEAQGVSAAERVLLGGLSGGDASSGESTIYDSMPKAAKDIFTNIFGNEQNAREWLAVYGAGINATATTASVTKNPFASLLAFPIGLLAETKKVWNSYMDAVAKGKQNEDLTRKRELLLQNQNPSFAFSGNENEMFLNYGNWLTQILKKPASGDIGTYFEDNLRKYEQKQIFTNQLLDEWKNQDNKISQAKSKTITEKDYDRLHVSSASNEYAGEIGRRKKMISFEKAQEDYSKAREANKTRGGKQIRREYSSGGIVYASNGTLVNFRPKGTDTVPAMLTPGEFVINRESTQKYKPVLDAINSGNYNRGGIVNYLNQGGYIPEYKFLGGMTGGSNVIGKPFDFTKYLNGLVGSITSGITEAFNKALSDLKPQNNGAGGVSNNGADIASIDNFVNRLNNIANILSNIYIPPQITITGKHDVVVTINGDTVLNQLRPDIAGIVVSAIRGAFADLKAKNPENNTINFDIDINANRFSGNA